ncbi:hypothetical protein BKA69DRAFT_267738 [Paraphysoderma sedebokerense]|nr:hypothetical protein BKA69DRAFT_267738 [Paraphysoderma sedebokerense]
MKASLKKLMSDRAVLFFFLACLICSASAWHVAPYIPTPWYLNTSASVNLRPGSTIIDTFSLYNSDYYALTGINGSNIVGFYRYRVGSNEWVGVNTSLDGIAWGYDNQSESESMDDNPVYHLCLFKSTGFSAISSARYCFRRLL